jgi:hypothetical protein
MERANPSVMVSRDFIDSPLGSCKNEMVTLIGVQDCGFTVPR